MANTVSLRDVAALARVSLGTASQAINNRDNVAPETRDRVLHAARSLGYKMKSPTPNLPQPALSVIGTLTMHDAWLSDEPPVNPFYSHVQVGVESECRRRGISLMVSMLEVDQHKHPVVWPPMIRDQRVEGLLLIGAFLDNTLERINQTFSGPIVLIDSYSSYPFDTVLTDNDQGVQLAVQHLIDYGHRHIGLVGWSAQCHPSINERKESYLRTLKKNGISPAYIEESLLTRDAGGQATLRLLQRAPQVSAIFACNDDTAMGVIKAAQSLGLSVPEDLSVVGFDNIDLAASYTPPLTTVHVYKAWMGIMGVRRMIERVQFPDEPRVSTRINTQFIQRGSVSLRNY